MLIGKQAQPYGTDQHDSDHGRPPGTEPLCDQRRLPMELAAAGQQRRQRDTKNDGLFIIKVLEQREDHPCPEQDHRSGPATAAAPFRRHPNPPERN